MLCGLKLERPGQIRPVPMKRDMDSENSGPRQPASGAMREWLWYLGTATGAAFAANWIWEMLQMSAYRDLAEKPWRQMLGPCTHAAAGDVFLTLFAYALGAAISRRWRWSCSGRPTTYFTLGILGLSVACMVEYGGLALGLWSYNEHMPLVLGTRLGVLPLAQLTLLVPLSFCAGDAARRSVFKPRSPY
jgi:hypothetical protein